MKRINPWNVWPDLQLSDIEAYKDLFDLVGKEKADSYFAKHVLVSAASFAVPLIREEDEEDIEPQKLAAASVGIESHVDKVWAQFVPIHDLTFSVTDRPQGQDFLRVRKICLSLKVFLSEPKKFKDSLDC